MKSPKIAINYDIPKEDLNINIDDIEKENNIMGKFFEKFENIENNYYNSQILAEISNSKVKMNQSNLSKINSSLFIHNGIKCENCQNLPIIGERYKCPKCLNYNLCNECEQLNSETNFHPHNNFILYRDPEVLTKNIGCDYSFRCLDKKDIHVKVGTDSFVNTIELLNDGNQQWPDNSILKCKKEMSTIFCEKVDLPSIDINDTTKITLYFNKCNKMKKGEYSCIINFYINGKIIRGPIDIKVFIE